MELLQNYLARTEFDSYEDFKKNFKLTVPEDFDFARDIIDAWERQEPEKKALLYCDDTGCEKWFTFADIARLSRKAASFFESQGIHAGDRVMTLMRRRYEYWICAVALHRIGATLIPASIQLTTKDIVYRVNAAKVKMIVAISEEFVLSQLSGVFEKCETLQKVALVGEKEIPAGYLDFDRGMQESEEWKEYSGLKNDDEMLIYFTSGTSGMPKMVVHNRTYPLGHIVTARYMQCVQNNGLHLTFSDSGWAKFGWGNIYGQWICGTAILGYDPIRFHSVKLMEIMKKYKPTSLCIPPTMYRFLLHDGLKQEHVASIQWYATAGEPLDPEVNKEFYRITGHMIHEGFGQSETTPITCSFEWLKIRPGSMGKPSPLYDVRIVDMDGNECECGDPGEIIMRVSEEKTPIGLLCGYHMDGKTVRNYDSVYHTGDIAYADEDGYYWYVGRNDDMIKCSGYRIGPFEIESVLNTHPSVRESAIVGRPDPLRGQVVCAVIVLQPGYTPSEELTKELKEYVKKNTAPYKYPRIIEYVSELPKTTSGKTIRHVLRK